MAAGSENPNSSARLQIILAVIALIGTLGAAVVTILPSILERSNTERPKPELPAPVPSPSTANPAPSVPVEASPERPTTSLPSGSTPSAPAKTSPIELQWRERRVDLTGGNVLLDGGYEIRNVKYEFNQQLKEHTFSFDLYGQKGERLRSGVPYNGNNNMPWQQQTVELYVDGRTLVFAFSNFNNGAGRFRYAWK